MEIVLKIFVWTFIAIIIGFVLLLFLILTQKPLFKDKNEDETHDLL